MIVENLIFGSILIIPVTYVLITYDHTLQLFVSRPKSKTEECENENYLANITDHFVQKAWNKYD